MGQCNAGRPLERFWQNFLLFFDGFLSTSVLLSRILTLWVYRVFKKIPPPPKTFRNIFTSIKSLSMKFVGNSYPHSTNYCRFILLGPISSNGINFSTSTYRFYPVKFWVGLFSQKMQMHLFGNDVIFSSSRVVVSSNCKQLITVGFLLLTFYWHCFKAWYWVYQRQNCLTKTNYW